MHGPEWSETLQVGIAPVDLEHEELAGCINRCIVAGECDAGDDAVRTLVADVIIVASRHFANEERIMGRIGYPALDAHLRAHEAALTQLYTYGLRQHGAALSTSVGIFLKSWFLAHIATYDHAFGQWLAARKYPLDA